MVNLTEPFFREITEHSIPVDMQTILAQKRSPISLEICCCLLYRTNYSKKPSMIPSAVRAIQFGSDYAWMRDFKASLLIKLPKVATVHVAAQFEAAKNGLLVQPSALHISRQSAL